MIVRGAPRQKPGTLTQLFFETIDKHSRPDAYQVKRGGKYVAIAHGEVLTRVRHLALGLQELG